MCWRAKYADHLPLYRQAQIYSRQGVDLDRSTLADWVGRAAFELRPVHDALMADLKRSTKLFMDETRAPVLDPGARKTKTGYFWALARDDHPWGGTSPPGVAFTYAPGRGGQHAARILQGFGGILQVDGYAGYNRLIAPDRIGPSIQLAHCWAHARRKLIEITRNGSAPIAEEGVTLIRDLYAIEVDIRRNDPATRLAVRQERSAPILARIDTWLSHHRARASAKSPLGEALAYIAKYRDGLGRFLTDGRVELDSNTVERTIRPIATAESLCTPSSTVCKHWKRVCIGEATRATVSGYRGLNLRRVEIIGTDLVRRATNNLLGRQHACLDEAAYPVVCDAQGFRSFGHGQPGAILFRGPVGVDATHAPDRGDTVGRPGFALSCRHAHAIERSGNMFVRPTSCHASHHRQRILGGCATMFACSRFAHPQFRMATAPPVDREDDLAHRILNIHDNIGNQRAEQLLARSHRHIGRIPGH